MTAILYYCTNACELGKGEWNFELDLKGEKWLEMGTLSLKHDSSKQEVKIDHQHVAVVQFFFFCLIWYFCVKNILQVFCSKIQKVCSLEKLVAAHPI